MLFNYFYIIFIIVMN